MPSESTRTKALDALEGMRSIVRREMVEAGSYVDNAVTNPNLSDAICGGRKHCAIGSLWVGGGIKHRVEKWDSGHVIVSLPGTNDGGERQDFLRHRPGLRLAYDSLNAAADAFADRVGIDLTATEDWQEDFEAPIEALFENHYGAIGGFDKRDLLSVIAAAKRRVKAA